MTVRSAVAPWLLALWACSGATDSTPTTSPTPTPTPTPTPSPTPTPTPTPGGCGTPVAGTAFKLQDVVTAGLSSPLHAASAPGDVARLFVVEQGGRIRLVKNGALLSAPYLDLSTQVSLGGERGLLSVAFHPSFAQNGKLYVYFTGNGTGDPNAGATGDLRIVEVQVPDPAADTAGNRTLVNLLTVPHQPYANHNGGQLAFGPDGLLYAGTGDGGSGGDPQENAQNTASLLGKLLRIDPASPGAVPAGNPFGNAVYHYGLRNPWRFSFDRRTGDLYVGDVGQGAWEEIDFEPAAAPGQPPAAGVNWGWDDMEGTHCYEPATGCLTAGRKLPVLEYSHAEGISVTGGFVYRGVRMPDLAATGTYFYGDYGTGFVRTFRMVNGVAADARDVTAALGGALGGLASFAEDGCGELYLLQLGGRVSKIVPGP